MFDICSIFKNLQKLFQKSNLILPDVLTTKDSAMEHLKVMKDLPIPGGKEEQNLENNSHEEDCDTSVRKAKTAHQFASSGSRDSRAIRNEIVESAINFLGQRMNTENDGTVQNLIQILDAKSSKEFIMASRELASQILGPSNPSDFVADVCSSWPNLSKIQHVEMEDTGTVYALRIRKMIQASVGLVKKFLASFLTVVPHSMATERAVSHYNNVKSAGRSSLLPETINTIMHISLNGKGAAFFDPRPAVYEFLSSRERRNREPNKQFYQQREFVKHFFKEKSGCL